MMFSSVFSQQAQYASQYQEQVVKVCIYLDAMGYIFTSKQVDSALIRSHVDPKALYFDLSCREETEAVHRFFTAINDETVTLYEVEYAPNPWSHLFPEARTDGDAMKKIENIMKQPEKQSEMPTMPPVRMIRRTLFPPFRIGIRQLVLYHGVVTRDAVKYVEWFNARNKEKE